MKMEWNFSKKHQERDSALAWPRDSEGGMEQAVVVERTGGNPIDSDMIVSLLEGCGIPTLRRDVADGAVGRVVLGSSGYGTDVCVPASLLADAQAILNGEAELVEE